ncbi:hypothetical protein GCM10009332_06440 [Shewanella gelidii]|uniref:Secreted protein n=2 Tax=Shewanella gelidii TaxID=1642821 RepID=A0A917JMG6_9GAMM|nr:hypothetical protein GCM10009332_06440 [Shewanella gelidii]
MTKIPNNLLTKIGMTTAVVIGMSPSVSVAANAQQVQFFERLASLCGKAFAGQVVSTDAADAKFAQQKLLMHVRECHETQLKIPFHVGEDRSRTWVLTQTEGGLRLKHDHRHKDGSIDAVTMYGGDTQNGGTASLQSFPVDQASIENFLANGLKASITNTWQMGVTAHTFSYRMFRQGRDFKVEFDLSKEMPLPQAPWGHE